MKDLHSDNYQEYLLEYLRNDSIEPYVIRYGKKIYEYKLMRSKEKLKELLDTLEKNRDIEKIVNLISKFKKLKPIDFLVEIRELVGKSLFVKVLTIYVLEDLIQHYEDILSSLIEYQDLELE